MIKSSNKPQAEVKVEIIDEEEKKVDPDFNPFK